MRIETRFDVARSSAAPPPSGEELGPELGTIVDWTPFQLEQLPLEWSAQRALSCGLERSRTIAIRTAGGRVMTAVLEDDTTPTDAIAAEVLRSIRGMESRTSVPVPPGAWRALELDGERIEWRTEQVDSMHARLAVHVTVRNPATGRSVGMALRGTRRPTVEDAVVAATLSERTLADDGDEEIDRVINTLGVPGSDDGSEPQ
jgi:hypothetical protein